MRKRKSRSGRSRNQHTLRGMKASQGDSARADDLLTVALAQSPATRPKHSTGMVDDKLPRLTQTAHAKSATDLGPLRTFLGRIDQNRTELERSDVERPPPSQATQFLVWALVPKQLSGSKTLHESYSVIGARQPCTDTGRSQFIARQIEQYSELFPPTLESVAAANFKLVKSNHWHVRLAWRLMQRHGDELPMLQHGWPHCRTSDWYGLVHT